MAISHVSLTASSDSNAGLANFIDTASIDPLGYPVLCFLAVSVAAA